MPHVSQASWHSLISRECQRRHSLKEVPLQLKDASAVTAAVSVSTESSRTDSLSMGDVYQQQQSWESTPTSHDTHSQIVAVEDNNSQGETPTYVSARSTRVSWKGMNSAQDALESCHRSFLAKRVCELQERVDAYQKELKKARRENKTLHARMEQALQRAGSTGKWDIVRTDADYSCLEMSTFKNSVRLSRRGFVALGVRKALAWSSSVAFPLLTLVDTSRQTVTRAENAVWAMIVSRSGAWHKCVYDALKQVANWMQCSAPQFQCTPDHADHADSLAMVSSDLGLPQPSSWLVHPWALCSQPDDQSGQQSLFSLGGTALSGDATNSGIWRRNKLQSLLVTSAIMSDPKHVRRTSAWHDGFSHHTTVCLALNVNYS